MRQPIPFGKYYLLERINVGGMAEVFKAKATGVEGFERIVAVKRILPSIAEDEEFITMFIDEAKIAVQLTHANIAQIFDLGKVDDSYFIALEYVHGKDLRAIFNRARARGEQLPVPMACYVIMKLCEGLDYAHNKRDAGGQFLNLVHRDVSPQNILVSYEGEVKIIDFGIAKAAGKAGRTQAGILKGKFGYMSPEQVQGFEIDRRSDVFGVGICLYELLTGERLFVGESDFATLEKVRNVDIMPPSTYNRRIPEELEQIVLKALARDREHAPPDRDAAARRAAGLHVRQRQLLRPPRSQHVHAPRVRRGDRARERARSGIRRDERARARRDHRPDRVRRDRSGEHGQRAERAAGGQQPRPAADAHAPYPAGTVAPRAASARGMPVSTRRRRTAAAHQARRRPGRTRPRLLGAADRAQPMRAAHARGRRRPGLPRPMVPPLVPRPQSIPPSHPRYRRQPPRLDMDWDDEELSTQIYDRPGGARARRTGQRSGRPGVGLVPAGAGQSAHARSAGPPAQLRAARAATGRSVAVHAQHGRSAHGGARRRRFAWPATGVAAAPADAGGGGRGGRDHRRDRRGVDGVPPSGVRNAST